MPKSLIAQFSTGSKDDKFKAYFNFVGGKQNDNKKVVTGRSRSNFCGVQQISVWDSTQQLQSVQLKDTADRHGTTSKWWGAALYLNFDPVSWFGMTLRGEYIGDDDEYLGFKNVFAPTLSFNFKADNLTIIPEFRLDNAGNSVFYKNETETTKSTVSFVLAATYHF